MKKITIISLLCLCVLYVHAQRTKIFSLSPMTRETAKVNGVVVGLGHLDYDSLQRQINGVNIDLFILSPLVVLYGDPTRLEEEPTRLISNGVNLGLGGFLHRGTVHRGLSVAMYSVAKKLDGVSVQATYTSVQKLNGLHLSVIGNFSEELHGVGVGIYNSNHRTQGIQLGIFNKSKRTVGLQIGLINVSKSVSGLQLGIWNENARRSLPFINF
ncbi:LA_2272 family surface repeat-containing protein [Sphingobacterium paludis]|uniref:Type IX secretion system PorP/SprF family membrane protein n=1 Tax=Sphingobacterium paludis TaxID=1476465 RepID=A0A4R7D939_9SPHI|nr:hypothetical protein [Sphingobacterium paludis]TDS17540.1 hypothetical protein B0I21_101407 [Sphingobacterium paludis]